MYTFIILFFISLLGLVFMIGRKVIHLRKGMLVEINEEVIFEIPHPREVTAITSKHAKRYGYLALVNTIKVYVRSTNLLKNSYIHIKDRAGSTFGKYLPRRKETGVDTSSFLKTVSEYKQRLSEITNLVKEEEGKR